MKQLIGITLILLAVNLTTSFAAGTQACKYVSEGPVQQIWKKVRIQSVGGNSITGADNFSEAISMGQGLVASQVCVPKVQDCRMASEGIVGGVWMKHRLQMDGDMVFGADDMATSLSQLSELRRLGFCK